MRVVFPSGMQKDLENFVSVLKVKKYFQVASVVANPNTLDQKNKD